MPRVIITPHQANAGGGAIRFYAKLLKRIEQSGCNTFRLDDLGPQRTSMRHMRTLTEHDIAYLMVGRDISHDRLPESPGIGDVRLAVKNLSYTDEEGLPLLKQISFDVRGGEILGLAGVEGNGQTPLINALTGLLDGISGEISISGSSIAGRTPRQIREKGLAHIPEDRMENGIADIASLEENFIVDRYFKATFSRRLRLLWKEIGDHSRDLIKRFNILARSSRTAAGSLSGGNIQKVVVARELSSNPDVIIAAQPTRGIDVGSEEMVHNLLRDARDEGKAVFLISADLDEVLKLSSRVIVLYDGEIVKHFTDIAGITGRDLGPYMLGVKREEGAHGTLRS